MVKHDENHLRSFDRKALGKISGRILKNWCCHKNCEIYKLCDKYGVKCIKVGRLRWAGHVMRTKECDPAKKVLCTKSQGNGDRRRGRPKWRTSYGLSAETGELMHSEERNGESH